MKKILPAIAFACSFLFLGSCASILGLHPPKHLSKRQIEVYANKFDMEKTYAVAPDHFFATYHSLKVDSNSTVFDKLYQPLQLIVFNNKGENICHLVNCNIGGFPLKWNRYGSFDAVPVLPKDFIQPDYKVTYTEVISYLEPGISKNEFEEYLREYDYIYLVYYAKCVNGITKPYLRLINNYKDQFNSSRIKYLYINTDELLYQLEKG